MTNDEVNLRNMMNLKNSSTFQQSCRSDDSTCKNCHIMDLERNSPFNSHVKLKTK